MGTVVEGIPGLRTELIRRLQAASIGVKLTRDRLCVRLRRNVILCWAPKIVSVFFFMFYFEVLVIGG